jgi:hypothetical protein
MIRSSILLFIAAGLGTGATLSAAELTTPQPTLRVWRDEAQLEYHVELPAGEHTLTLPLRPLGAITVNGAAARIEERITPAAVEAPPAALLALIDERNAWAADTLVLTDRVALHATTLAQLRTRLPPLASRPAPDTAAWQTALDAWLEEDAAIAKEQAALSVRQSAFLERATAIVHDPELARELLASDAGAISVLTPTAVLAAWARVPRAPLRQRIVHLACATATTARVTVAAPGISWNPAAALNVHGTSATLVRQVHLCKPLDLALGRLTVSVATGVRAPVLDGPVARPVDARLNAEDREAGRQVVVGSQTSRWEAAKPEAVKPEAKPDAASFAPVPATVEVDAAPQGREEAVVVEAPPGPARDAPVTSLATTDRTTRTDDTPPGLAETWDLGQLDLPDGEADVVVDRPASTLAVGSDEWAVIPQAGPILVRRLGITLDDRPLHAGPLTLTVDGVVIGTSRLQLQTPGRTLWLRGGEDSSIFSQDAIPWDLKGEEADTPQHHITGTTLPVRNLGSAARQVRIYRTWPISRSASVLITRHARTTPGVSEGEPGVLHWDVTIPAGGKADIDLGWQVQATGSSRL